MRLPDFILMGAAKSGTTSVHRLLEQHPGVWMCDPKEPEFFARDEQYDAGLASYAALYDAAPPEARLGEASTIYTRYPALGPESLPRLAEAVPDARLVYIVREPVARTYSDYCQWMSNHLRWGGQHAVFTSFGDAVREHAELLDASRYATQVRRMLEFYPAERLHVCRFEDFTQDPQSVMDALCDFLDVPRRPVELEHRNAARDQFRGIARERMLDRVRGRRWLRCVKAVVPRSVRVKLYDRLASSRLTRGMRAGIEPGPRDEATCAWLAAELQAEVADFAALTGVDVGPWQEAWRSQGWSGADADAATRSAPP